MSDEARRQNLAHFLRARRERLAPEAVGLNRGERRRTSGLRREEVAQLANVSVSWYTLLEQGRNIHPSRDVLHGIADALQLTPTEREHLFLLADPQHLIETYVSYDKMVDEEISPALHRVLEALDPVPAYILGRRWRYLAWNRAAEQVFLLSKSAAYGYNVIWRVFADPAVRHVYHQHWEQVAQKVLAEFRAQSAPYSHEEWFKTWIADLQRVSPEFRTWWSQHDVRKIADTRKEIHHPLVGRLLFEHTTLQVPSVPDLKVMIYTPLPETDTLTKLQKVMAETENASVHVVK